MKLPTRMTSSTGNNKRGFTFIEVMIALVVLSTGIVLVYKSFFLCVDYLNNLSTRVYATHLLDSRIAEINRSLAKGTGGSLHLGPLSETVPINRRQVKYDFDMRLDQLGAGSLYKLTIDLTWFDGRRKMREGRAAYLMR